MPLLSHCERVHTRGKDGLAGSCLPSPCVPLVSGPYGPHQAARLRCVSLCERRVLLLEARHRTERPLDDALGFRRRLGSQDDRHECEVLHEWGHGERRQIHHEGPAGAAQVQQRDGGVKRVRWYGGGAARGGCGCACQDARRDKVAGLIEPQHLQRQPPAKGPPVGQTTSHGAAAPDALVQTEIATIFVPNQPEVWGSPRQDVTVGVLIQCVQSLVCVLVSDQTHWRFASALGSRRPTSRDSGARCMPRAAT